MAEAKSRRELPPRPRPRKPDVPDDNDDRTPEERGALLTESVPSESDALEPRDEAEASVAEEPRPMPARRR